MINTVPAALVVLTAWELTRCLAMNGTVPLSPQRLAQAAGDGAVVVFSVSAAPGVTVRNQDIRFDRLAAAEEPSGWLGGGGAGTPEPGDAGAERRYFAFRVPAGVYRLGSFSTAVQVPPELASVAGEGPSFTVPAGSLSYLGDLRYTEGDRALWSSALAQAEAATGSRLQALSPLAI